jgi:PAS domain S-box-containing protein
MNLDFLLKYVFASFLIVMLLSVAFFYDKEQQEQHFENNLLAITQEMGVFDLQLNQEVLKLQFGFNNEIEVTRRIEALNTDYHKLSGKISTERKLYDEEMHTQLAQLYSWLYQKRQAVKNFKRDYATFKQQLHHFEQLSNQLIQQENLDLATRNQLYQLQTLVLKNSLNFSPSALTAIQTELSQLSNNTNLHHSAIKQLILQAQNLLTNEEHLKLSLNAIIKIQKLTPAENIEKMIVSYFDNKRDKKSEVQNSLFIIAMLSVLYVVYLLSSLRKKSAILENVLTDVEKQQIALNEHAIVSAADVKGNITYVNKKFCETSGYSPEELLGQNHRIVKSGYHPPEVYEEMWHAICRGQIWHGEIKNKKKDGGFYWVNGTIVPFLNEKGKPYQYISIRTDITRQKELEKQLLDGQHFLKQVTGAMAQGLCALDANGLCTFWNKEAENILGWSEQELLHKDLHNIIHFQDEHGNPTSKETCLTHNSIINNKIYSSDTEFFTHKDGRILPISIIAVPLLEKDKTIGTVAVFSDITKRKADEKIVNQAIITAQQASQAKSDFLANMSHEIRTPMNGIIGMTELTLGTDLTSEQREYIEIVKDSSYALLEIVNDILDFSKIEAGKIVLEHIEFDVNELLKKTIAMLIPKADQKGISLSIENDNITGALNFPLLGDPGRLRQVVLNLVGNAIKFTLHGSIKVSVALTEKTENKCCLLFTIVDTGIGIPQEKQAAIFEAFSQADTSVTRRFGGTGLGLSISKQFIELMAGKIWLESQPNVGTTFFFTCWFDCKPVNENPANNPQDQNPSPMSPNMTVEANEVPLKLNILLAEDNLINQKLAKKLLEKQGHEVHIANNGIEAVILFEQRPFDLILMDFQMPEMNGLEAASKIREIEQTKGGHIPIIAMTANAMKEDKDRAISAGMDAYVPKPINVQELLTEISRFFAPTAASALQPQESDDSKLCNWDGALARLGGEAEILQMLVNLFLEEQASYLENIHKALDNEDGTVLQRELHTLRGVCATIGAESIEDAIRAPEALAGQKNFADCATLLPEIERDIARLVKFLNKKMNPA